LTTGAAADGLRERMADMRQRIASGRMQAQRKQNLFDDLDGARMTMARYRESQVAVKEVAKLDLDGAAAKYAAVFAKFGLEVQPERSGILIQRIRAEEPAVRDALIAALDHWAFCASKPLDAELLALARAADQDE